MKRSAPENELDRLKKRIQKLESIEMEHTRIEKSLRERETELSTIFDNIPIIMFLVDRERRVHRVNKAMMAFAGRSAQDMLGLRGGEALRCLHALDSPDGCGFGDDCQTCITRKTVLDTFKTGKGNLHIEASLPFDLGSGQQDIFFHLSTSPIDISGEEMVLVSIEDITGLKHAENQLKVLLKEKDVLLKEVHHRVKNNFNIVASLLGLQSEQIQDSKAKELCRMSRDRIRTMAVVHEQLYRSESLADISTSDYLRNLAVGLFKSYNPDPSRIALHTDIQEIKLDIDLAIPIGLIVNELLANALKHAFPPSFDKKGKIEMSCHQDKNSNIELIFQDNGIGKRHLQDHGRDIPGHKGTVGRD